MWLTLNKDTMAEFILEPLDAHYLELGGCVEFRLNRVQLHSKMFLIHLDSVATFPLNLLFDQHLVIAKEWGVEKDNMDVPKGVYIRASAVHFVTKDRWTLKAKIKKKAKKTQNTCSTLWERSISFLLYWEILATVVAWFFWSSLMSLEMI